MLHDFSPMKKKSLVSEISIRDNNKFTLIYPSQEDKIDNDVGILLGYSLMFTLTFGMLCFCLCFFPFWLFLDIFKVSF